MGKVVLWVLSITASLLGVLLLLAGIEKHWALGAAAASFAFSACTNPLVARSLPVLDKGWKSAVAAVFSLMVGIGCLAVTSKADPETVSASASDAQTNSFDADFKQLELKEQTELDKAKADLKKRVIAACNMTEREYQSVVFAGSFKMNINDRESVRTYLEKSDPSSSSKVSPEVIDIFMHDAKHDKEMIGSMRKYEAMSDEERMDAQVGKICREKETSQIIEKLSHR